MSYSPKEQKAIGLYCDQHNAMPQLSIRPKIRFLLKDTGETIDQNITLLVADYQKWVKEEAKQKKTEKDDAKRKENLKGGYKQQY